jgi:TP901 family phage tail tape measure protein
MAAITLDIAGNTRQLDRDIQKTVNKVYTINLKTKGDQPLGRITGQVNEFNKSLDASNARVIAFGASAGIIFGLERAFTALVTSTIEVQKSLQDINVILNASTSELQKFGSQLFGIAKNTGQSFQEVAKAATEFSRQGLGIQETLKRTNEALILSRLSGLDAAKSVEALTAAVNSYASESVTATEIVNKFATVDAAFAVSSADLADAIARVGSSAAQSGVSLNELIAIVTSAQQTTARGGAVIGNSFKTIFTRLQREKVVDLLESLGISGTDSSGQVKSTIQLLTDLGAVYDTLGSQQQAYVAEQVGGVFQINILKAALADLGKEYSIYSSALNVSAGATDQAIRRNEELNKTYSAQINALVENARQLAAAGGESLLGPSIDRLVGGTNAILGGINQKDGQGVGTVLGKGILDGLGQFIAGPGLVLIGGVLLKLFRDLAKFATGSFQQLLGLNTAATQQRDLQASIQQILSKNPQLINLALQSEQGLNAAANTLLASLQKQTVELQKQSQVAAQISKAFVAQAGARVVGGVPVIPTKTGKAAGYIPNFANDDFAREELLARTLGAKNPSAQLSKGTIDGKKFIKNNREIEITNFGKNGDSAVIPTYGRGFIPNFAGITSLYSLAKGSKIEDYKTLLTQGSNYKGQFQKPFGSLTKDEANQALARARANKGQISNTSKSSITNLGKTNKISLIYGQKAGVKSVSGLFTDSNKNRYSATFASSGYNAKVEPDESNLEDLLGKQVIDFVNRFSSIFGGNSGAAKIGSINQLANAGAFRSIAGTIFETAVTQATGSAIAQASRSGGQSAAIDYVSPNPKLRKLFNNIPGSYEAKIGDNQDLVNSVADKAYRSGFFKKQGVFPGAKTKNMAAGYIPNFAAIQDAINREREAGIPKNQIYLAQEKALTSANPMGIGVFNKRDEPNKSSRKDAMRRRGFAKGYIPNFAETPESGAASIGTAATAIAAQLSTLAFTFAFSKNEVKQAMTDLAKSTKNAASVQRNQLAKDIKEKRREVQAQSLGGKVLTSAERKEITKQNAQTLRQDQTLAQRRETATQNIKPGFGAKAKAFGGANSLGLALAAPILAQTISQAIPQETKTGRVSAAGVGALGNIGAGAATGFLVGGPIGAAVGAAASALLEIPNFVNSITTKVPELEKSLTKASSELTKFSDAGSRLLTSSSELQAAYSETSTSQDKINKLTEQFANALGDLSIEDQNRLKSAQKVGKLEEEYAKILSERTKELQGKEAALALQKSAEEKGVLGKQTISGVAGSENEKLLKSTFKNLLTGGGQDQKALQALQESASSGIPQLQKLQQRAITDIDPFSGVFDVDFVPITNELKNVLNQVIPESETKADQINSILANASKSPESLTNVIEVLIATYGEEEQSIKNIIKIGNEKKRLDTEEAAARKEAIIAIQNTITAITTNVAKLNIWRNAIDNFTENARNFEENLRISTQYTNPLENLQTIFQGNQNLKGRSPLEQKLEIGGGLATAQNEFTSNVNTIFNEFKSTIRTALEESFQAGFDEIGQGLSSENLQGTKENINKTGNEARKKAEEQANKLTSAMTNVESLMNQLVSGQISANDFQNATVNSVDRATNATNRSAKLSSQIETAVAQSGAKLLAAAQAAQQVRKTLATEQVQKAIQENIAKALGLFGGVEGFLNRPEEGYSNKFIAPVIDEVKKQRSDISFRYSNPESVEGRREQMPDLARAYIKMYDEFNKISGGAFRDELQNRIDTGVIDKTQGKGGRLADTGGFDDIVSGIQVDLENELKVLKDRLKVEQQSGGDSGIAKDLKLLINSIEGVGIENAAILQAMQATGVARQSDLKNIRGEYADPVLKVLENIPGLEGVTAEVAKSLSAEGNVDFDPLLNQSTLQSSLQSQMVGFLSGIQDALVKTATGQTDKIQAYNPDEIIKKMLETEAASKTGNGKEAQGQKSTAQIEEETKLTRERAQSMGMTVKEYKKEFPNGAPQMGPEASPDYKKYQELSKPGQTFKSQDDLLLNFLQRLNFKETGRIPSPEALGFGDKKEEKSVKTIEEKPIAQQEAAVSQNTNAVTGLTTAIENLRTSLSEPKKENTPSNGETNGTPNRTGVNTNTGSTPNISTNTNAPVTVVVNAESQTDIATAIGQAVQNAIPQIIEKVKIAMGERVPPTPPNMFTG